MKLTQLLQVFWARRRLFFSVLGALFVVVLAACLIMPKAYVAQVSLVADLKNTDLISGAAVQPQLATGYLATQMDVIASHNVALKVVDRLKLNEMAQFRRKFQDSTGGAGSIRDWLADQLIEKLEVKPSRESNVINVDFAAPDPNFAAAIANAFASAYIETSLELKIDPARNQATWFDEQLLGLRKTLQAAQQRLSDYQQKNNAVGNDDRLDIENSRLTELANQLVAAQAAMYDTQTRQKQMLQALEKNQLEQLPDILGNGLLQSMKADLTRTESKLAEVAVRYGRNHPQYISAAAEAQSLRDRLARELDTAKGSINQAAQIAQQRTAEVQRALDDQRQRILELKQQRDALDVLNREVDSARHTYDAATQRASQVRLESLLNQSSIAILNPAVAPIKPARPKLLLSLVLAIVAGVISGAGVTLFAELMDRRVRSAVDIVAVGGLTVLAELSRPSPKPKIKRLIQAITPAPIPRIQSA